MEGTSSYAHNPREAHSRVSRTRDRIFHLILGDLFKMPQPNGSAPEAPTKTPTVVGINFGNSYASIAVITKVRTGFKSLVIVRCVI